jgi:hypothetical protein
MKSKRRQLLEEALEEADREEMESVSLLYDDVLDEPRIEEL